MPKLGTIDSSTLQSYVERWGGIVHRGLSESNRSRVESWGSFPPTSFLSKNLAFSSRKVRIMLSTRVFIEVHALISI